VVKRRDDDTVVGRITSILGQRIVSGQLPPGERLRQDRIAAEFGASHVPVREAFRRLEAQGLASGEPRRGVRVAALSPAMVLEVTEMRAALEALALRHAIARMPQSAIESARAAISEAEASDDMAILEQANRRFHRALLEPCGMPRLMSTIDDLHHASSRFLLATWRERNWQNRSDNEHRLILAAIIERDGDKASGLLREHINAAGCALVEGLAERE